MVDHFAMRKIIEKFIGHKPIIISLLNIPFVWDHVSIFNHFASWCKNKHDAFQKMHV